jgi:2,3-dihydroxybenzoate-AMP ligase
MLDGVVPFPPEFAKRYRDRGYWADKSLAEEFGVAFRRFANRVALIDRGKSITYAELDRLSTNLALHLLGAGFGPLDRVVVQLPNVGEFVILYFALQKIGCVPIAALVTHRFAEISQFVELSGAKACVISEPHGDSDYVDMVNRIRKRSPTLEFGILLGEPREGFLSLSDMIATPAKLPVSALSELHLDPSDPAVFQLSGGTTGIPKLIPRTHNDYAYNSKAASRVCGITADSIGLIVLPIAHNLPLACPGIQGFMFHGGSVVISMSTRPDDMCALIEKHRVTHLKVVPALLIRLLNDPAVIKYDLSSLRYIQSGGQRLQPEVRLLTRRLIPSVGRSFDVCANRRSRRCSS